MVNRSNTTTAQSAITSEVRFFETLMFELPTGLVMDLSGNADMRKLRQAAWTLYDSWIRLAVGASNTLSAHGRSPV